MIELTLNCTSPNELSFTLTLAEAKMLTEVKAIMKNVCDKLDQQTDTELSAFLK